MSKTKSMKNFPSMDMPPVALLHASLCYSPISYGNNLVPLSPNCPLGLLAYHAKYNRWSVIN